VDRFTEKKSRPASLDCAITDHIWL